MIMAAAIAAGLVVKISNIGAHEMPRLEVELVVTEPLRSSGGPVFVSINRLAKDTFEARYPNKDAAAAVPLVQQARVSAMANFVEIDTPEGDYVYRFINDPDGPNAAKTIDQEPIGEAGAGALYIDLATNEPVQSNGGRDHHIFGAKVSKAESIGLQNNSLDLRVDPATCVSSGPVRVCPARQAEVDVLLNVFRTEAAE